jgi:hypothetical protein
VNLPADVLASAQALKNQGILRVGLCTCVEPEMAEDWRRTRCVETASIMCLPKGCPRSSFMAPGHFHLRMCMLCGYRSFLYRIHHLARLHYSGSCPPVKVVQRMCRRRRQRGVTCESVRPAKVVRVVIDDTMAGRVAFVSIGVRAGRWAPVIMSVHKVVAWPAYYRNLSSGRMSCLCGS